MINLFNKYKRWFYSALFLLVFILMFFPYTIESIFNNLILFNGALGLFTYGHLYLDYWHDGHRLFYKLRATQNMIGGTILILGIIICILTAIFINKKYKSYSLGFILIAIACVIKIFATSDGILTTQGEKTISFTLTKYGDAWTDYVIISIALLMLIVDIVRLSLYIRAHKDEIHAKAADISARFKTKLQREHKPTKDERIAELEERVKQLENKQDE